MAGPADVDGIEPGDHQLTRSVADADVARGRYDLRIETIRDQSMALESVNSLLHAATIAAFLAMTSCSGSSGGAVDYSGTTLTVLGKQYKRVEAKDYDNIWGRGAVLVTARQWREAEVEAVLKQFSLDVIGKKSGSTPGAAVEYAVAVPAGFEEQWANALSAQPSVFTTANEDPTIDRP